MQTFFKLLLVIGLLTSVSSCSTSEHHSNNFTDTIRVVYKRILFRQDTIAPNDTSRARIIVIRQKTDSTLKFTYCWKGSTKDSSKVDYYTFNIKNDSFQLVDWFSYEQKSRSNYDKVNRKGYVLVSSYEDKGSDSIKLYTYELVNPDIDGLRAVIFSKEYGMVSWLHLSWGTGSLITHWDGKPVDAQTYFMSKIGQLAVSEMTTEQIQKEWEKIVW